MVSFIYHLVRRKSKNMLSVILFILKLIGILLAFIVGLVVLLLLLILLVPIRYKVYARFEDDIFGEIKVHWLLKIIHFHVYYMDNKMRMRLRLFGIVIYNPDRVKKKKKKKNINKTKNKRDNKDINKKNQRAIKKTKVKSKAKGKDNYKDNYKEKDNEKLLASEKLQQSENLPQSEKLQQNENLPHIEQKQINDSLKEENAIPKEVAKDITKSISTDRNKEVANDINGNSSLDKQGDLGKDNTIKTSLNENKSQSKSKLVRFLMNTYSKVKSIFKNLREAPTKIRDFIYSFIDKIRKSINRVNEIINKVRAFIKDEINKDSFLNIFGGIGQILKHVKPRKLVIRIELGMEDPAITGMALGLLSILIGLHGEHVTITPNFNDRVFKANLLAIGRLRTVKLLIIGLRLAIYKNNKQLLNNIKAFKEEL